MIKEAIGDGAIGGTSRAMLTVDFGRTRLVETLKATDVSRAAAAAREEKTQARRHAGTTAMRP